VLKNSSFGISNGREARHTMACKIEKQQQHKKGKEKWKTNNWP